MDGDDEQAVHKGRPWRRLLRDMHFTRGWSRITRDTAVPIFVTLTVEGPLSRVELHDQLRRWTDGQGHGRTGQGP